MLLEIIGHTKLIANSGLIDATKEFNYSQNDKFIVFAVNFMRNHIEKALEEKIIYIFANRNKLVINNLKYKVMGKIEGFEFKEGEVAFKELVNNSNQETIKTAYDEFNDYKGSISKWIEDNKEKKDIIKLLDKINKFVSYCDVNALSTDSEGNPFQNPEKKSIAKAFVFQHSWVRNILKYLKEDKLDNVSHSVRKAIEYFKDPENKFPILSENHRKKISLHYLGDVLEGENFDKNLKLKATKWNNNNKHNNYNLTYEYTKHIYSNEERSQWDCKVDTTLLESNKNLILTGAPGTGKTYLAKQMARKLTRDKTGNIKEENISFVQFHPSYDYTDFVEGLRPIKDSNGNIVFERKDGIFKEFCKKASKKASKKADEKFVFIIDEINRGEISKIFGELFFSIDPGYREEEGKIKTQYQNLLENTDDEYKDGFFIPKNVYIIGTMNDIDRSVESMDFAFRRRFAFQEITAEDTMDSILYELGDDMNDAVNKMRAINSTLDTLGLNSNYHIGAAYFQKVKNYKNKWNDLWNLHLKGTLFEYFRGEPDADNKIKQLKKAYDNAENNK